MKGILDIFISLRLKFLFSSLKNVTDIWRQDKANLHFIQHVCGLIWSQFTQHLLLKPLHAPRMKNCSLQHSVSVKFDLKHLCSTLRRWSGSDRYWEMVWRGDRYWEMVWRGADLQCQCLPVHLPIGTKVTLGLQLADTDPTVYWC